MSDKKYKILLAEDDETIGSMYKIKFEADGHEVLLATDGADCLELAKKEKVDLILLDIIMPRLDGFSVLYEIKQDPAHINNATPAIMLTNLGTDEDIEKGKRMGAADYIVKSNFTPAQVSEKIKPYLK